MGEQQQRKDSADDLSRSNDGEENGLDRDRALEEGRREFEMVRRRMERFDPERWEAALEQKRRMERFAPGSYDPGASISKELEEAEIGLFVGDTEIEASVRPTENPNERSSFGFVDSFAEVSSEASFVPGTLVLRFDPERLGSVAPETLRLFRWHEETSSYQLVRESGIGEGENYVWGRITEPGRYALIGLNADPLVLRTVNMLFNVKDLLGVVGPEVQQQIHHGICQLILCASEVYDSLEDPEALQELVEGGLARGLPAPPPGWRPTMEGSAGNICEQCLGLPIDELPEVGWLPEFELLPPIEILRGWQSLGPSTWRENNVPRTLLSGCARQLAVDPNDPYTIYVASSDGGLWVCHNIFLTSTTWIPLTDQNDSLKISAVAIAPSNSQVLYVADGLGYVLRSNNRGTTWNRTSNFNMGYVVRRLLVHPLDANRVYAASNTGFWESVNGGASWTLLHTGDITEAAMDPTNPSILYIGQRYEGVRKSYDSGQTWTTVLPWSSASAPSISMIKIALGRQGNDLNRTVAVKFAEEVFVNRHGGRPLGTPGGGPWVSRGKRGGNGYGDWCHAIAVDPFNDNVILAGAQELYRTSDGGATWNGVASFYSPHEDQQSIVFDPVSPGRAYLANDGGVFRSEDGGATWPFDGPNKGLVTAQFFRAGVSSSNMVGNVYHSGIIASSSLDGIEWSGIEGHAWEFANIYGDPKRPNLFYVDHGGGLGRRRFPGTGANDFIIGFGNFDPTAIAVDTRSGSNTLLAGSHSPGRIMRALDGHLDAPNWAAEPGINIGGEPIVSIAFAPSNPGMAYAVSRSGRVFRKTDVNAADPWLHTGQWNASPVVELAVNARHPNRLYLITPNQVARSPNSGQTWIPIQGSGTNSLPNSEFNSIVAHPYDEQVLFLAADIGVFISRNQGQQWYPFDQNLPNAEVSQILWARDYLYAVTHGRGMWRRRP